MKKEIRSTNLIQLRKEQVELIEELAHVQEIMGMQPAMAKIYALLFVSDELELTFEEIKQTLGLSKSAVSQAVNQLLLTKQISYKTKLGDRKRYFHVRIDDWENQIMESFSSVAALVKVNKKLIRSRPSKTSEFNTQLKEMTDFLSFLQQQTPEVFKKIKRKEV